MNTRNMKQLFKRVYYRLFYNPIIKPLRRRFWYLDYFFLMIESKLDEKIFRFKIIDVFDYCTNRGMKFQIIESHEKCTVYIPDYINHPGGVKYYDQPDIYIAEIDDIKICGGCGALFAEKIALLDIVANYFEKRYDYAYCPIVRIDNNAKTGVIRYYRKKTDFIATGIYLLGFAPYNYYHATLEIISRLEYINKIREYDEIPILVDIAIKKIDSLRSILSFMNTSQRNIVWIEKYTMYSVGKLIFPSYNTWMPINFRKGVIAKPSDFLIAKTAISNLRSNTVNNFEIGLPKNKVYISRGNNAFRRLINETEVEKLFREKGFEIIDPAMYTFCEQVKIFAEAKIIAGTSGAAMTNLIFCAPETEFICILPRKYNFYLYSTIAYNCGMKCFFIDSNITREMRTNSEETYEVNISEVKELLISL